MCDGENGGKWTCASCSPVLKVHREMIRNLQAWGSGYEDQSIPEVLVAGDGNEYCLWDIKLFYDSREKTKRTSKTDPKTGLVTITEKPLLPDRMRQAIEMCLFNNMLEREAARAMGLSPSNPVSIYANVGIARMLSWAFQGDMGTYNPFVWAPALERNA